MASIKVSHNIGRMQKRFKEQTRFIQRKMRASQRRVAVSTLRSLKSKTPSSTGRTRKAWKMEKARGVGGRFASGWRIENEQPTMLWLEGGTKSHGPVTANMLFLPRRPDPLKLPGRSGYKRGMKYGYDFILTKRVAGIKKHNIVRNQLPLTRSMLKSGARKVIREARKR